MNLLKRLDQRVCRLNQAIEDFEKILWHQDAKCQLDMIEYVRQKLKSMREKRDEYLICIQAIAYLEEHLGKDEFEKIVTIHQDAID
ncbi:hypothetical protein HNQ80_001009 [Anaerosolibacter carboniphilus]|uniref:Uncharacterized protein n=1 Tax=Anaerosolibacter carboniphilus TaxID=1417629 RepID=A0A841KM94_9FIRM|nr:hypothetical protein [Anaerosolibacter carboniphilus]MBB6214924.1 hypothetical protein [Anaerosolibacter carboniphilus]